MVRAARQTYHKTHQAMFQQEGSYDLTSIFWGHGLGNKPFEHRNIQGAGDLDQPVGTESHQLHFQSLPKGHTFFPHGSANQITQNHGAKEDPLP